MANMGGSVDVNYMGMGIDHELPLTACLGRYMLMSQGMETGRMAVSSQMWFS
jgi:hypothetical protein